MKAKKVLLSLLSIVLVAVIAIGGTIAYLTDSESAVNVMILGDIDIVQHEQDRTGAEFKQGQTLMPIVGSTATKDANGYPAPSNYIDKIVTVENTGDNAAYVRTFIAIPRYTYDGQPAGAAAYANVIHWNGYSKGDAAPNYPVATRIPGTTTDVANEWSWGVDANASVWPGNGSSDWNTFDAVIDGQDYTVYVVTHTTAVAADAITAPNMIGVYLDSRVDYDHKEGVYTMDGKEIVGFDGTVEILVASQAVQYDAGWGNAWTALNTAFYTPDANNHPWVAGVAIPAVVENSDDLVDALGDGKDVILKDDVAAVTPNSGYGVGYVNVNGSTLNGNGNTLSVDGSGDYTAITTTGGTIENMGIDDGFRAIFLENMTEDVYLTDLKIGGDGVCYSINTGVNTGEYSMIVKNCQINGWSSFDQIKSASFTDCDFGQGGYYSDENGRLLKPYVNTTVTDCTFVDKYYLDLSSLKAGCKVTFKGCTINGVALTADVCESSKDWNDYYNLTKNMFVELPGDGRTLADCVIYE